MRWMGGSDSWVGEQAFEKFLLVLEATPTSMEDVNGGGGDEGGDDDAHQQRADPESRSALWKSPTDFCGFNFQTLYLQNTFKFLTS